MLNKIFKWPEISYFVGDMTHNYLGKDILIDENQAILLKKQGYLAMDPHCHTSFSYDVPDVLETSPEHIINSQKSKGLMPVITDHDTLKGYLAARKIDRKIIPGVEIRIKPEKARLIDYKKIHTLHINVFGLTKEQYDILENIAAINKDLDQFVQFLRDEDLEWTYNHPFWHDNHERLVWRAIPGLAKNYFDVIEMNAGMPKSMNDLALHIAQRLDKGVVASSDSHTGKPGTAYVLAEGKNFKDFWSNIKQGEMQIVRNDMNAITAVKEASYMISNIFRSNVNPAPEQRFRSAIGIRPVDKIATAVTSGWLKNTFIIKKALQMTMQTLNYSAGPLLAWRLYLRKNNVFADRIRKRIELMSLKMQDMTNNVKNNVKRTIEKDKMIASVKAKKRLA